MCCRRTVHEAAEGRNLLEGGCEVALSIESPSNGQGESYEPIQLVKLSLVVSLLSVFCVQPDVLCVFRERQVRRCQPCRKHGGWRR
jgi:hypothetical protein